MAVINPNHRTKVRFLELDPDLAEAVPLERRAQAVEDCVAAVLTVPTGTWHLARGNWPQDGVGLLVLAGLIVRRVGIHDRYGAEMLGEGDLLRPWQGEEDLPMLPTTTGWRVLQAARVAVLDDAFMARFAEHPELASRLIGRAVARSRNLAINMAIVQQARVDLRLQMLLWHLAARWGRVRTGEVHLPVRLTHSVLAELVAARRPTVTTALTDLARRGLVTSSDGGWLLSGEPPGELLELASSSAG